MLGVLALELRVVLPNDLELAVDGPLGAEVLAEGAASATLGVRDEQATVGHLQHVLMAHLYAVAAPRAEEMVHPGYSLKVVQVVVPPWNGYNCMRTMHQCTPLTRLVRRTKVTG